jgi:bifunctional DNase/RNase
MRVPVELSRVIVNELSDRQMLFLTERDGDRCLPIAIGVFEATSIQRYARGDFPPRPLSHQLIAASAEHLGGELQDVVITELRENTFFAVLRVRQGDRIVEVDCRPSDAIAVAVSCRPILPIYAAEEVLDAVEQG